MLNNCILRLRCLPRISNSGMEGEGKQDCWLRQWQQVPPPHLSSLWWTLVNRESLCGLRNVTRLHDAPQTKNFDAVWSFCWADLFYVPSLKWVSSVRGTQYDLTQKASCSHCKFLLARHRVPGRTPITISKF